MKLRRSSLVAALVVSCGAAVIGAQQLPADLDATSRARLPYVQRKDTDESSKRLFDIFVRNSNSPTDTLGGPLAFAAYNPYVATALLDQSGDPVLTGAGTRRAFDPKSTELAL